MTLTPYGEWIVDARFAETLEIETQELAEALEHMVSLFGDGDSASIKTVINASAALAAHKAKQPK